MQGQLNDKVCLITGATGIAAATIEQALEAGARVCFCSRTASRGEALVNRLGHAAALAYVPGDLTQPQIADEVAAHCVARFGRIDALFNVAGISGRRLGDGPVHECTDGAWTAIMQTNVQSMFNLCRAVVRQMLTQEVAADGLRGNILNMTSVLAFSPSAPYFGTHAYAASKGAIIALTRAMAASYAPGKIRVNAIAPALVRTPMSERAQTSAAINEFARTKQPLLEDFLSASDVARASIFLMSSAARAITGEIMTVDGGWCVSEGQLP